MSEYIFNADGSITIIGAVMPRFDIPLEESIAATKRTPGLQLVGEMEGYHQRSQNHLPEPLPESYWIEKNG